MIKRPFHTAALCLLAGTSAVLAQQSTSRPADTWHGQQESQAWATQKLAASPRRSEWITTKLGDRTLKAWVVYPQGTGKAAAVLVLHEVFGLTDSTRNTADEIAAMGYIAIAPDMLSGYGPDGGGVQSFVDSRGTADTLTTIPDAAIDAEISAWADYARALPRSTGKLALVGLSWGGGASFRYVAAVQRSDVKLACVFYDVGPPAEWQGSPEDRQKVLPVDGIEVPVEGFYGSTDTRVMNSLASTKDAMKAAGRGYTPVVYAGADHAFLRVGEAPGASPADVAAVQASLTRLRSLLAQSLR